MGRIKQENIELDEPAERFLSSLKTSTAKAYRGDLKKYILFLKETNRDYNTLSEFLDKIEKEREANRIRPLSERRHFIEEELQSNIRWMQDNKQSGRTIKRAVSTMHRWRLGCSW